jgi:hypothetical protein
VVGETEGRGGEERVGEGKTGEGRGGKGKVNLPKFTKLTNDETKFRRLLF